MDTELIQFLNKTGFYLGVYNNKLFLCYPDYDRNFLTAGVDAKDFMNYLKTMSLQVINENNLGDFHYDRWKEIYNYFHK